jgi:indolepyruvate ferredoxin oxidoreductase alpha subunit
MTRQAFDLSEKLRVPVLMRVTTRMAHSRAMVETTDAPRQQNSHSLPQNTQHFILLPAFAKRNYADLLAQQPEFIRLSEECGNNTYTRGTNPKRAIVTCGIAHNYMQEAGIAQGASILKITQYPLPVALINQMVADGAEEILVAEEGQPVVEELLRGLVPSTVKLKGRLTGDLPRMGELSPDCFAQSEIRNQHSCATRQTTFDVSGLRPPRYVHCPQRSCTRVQRGAHIRRHRLLHPGRALTFPCHTCLRRDGRINHYG